MLKLGYDIYKDNFLYRQFDTMSIISIATTGNVICFLAWVSRFAFSLTHFVREDILTVYTDNDTEALGKEMVFDLFLQPLKLFLTLTREYIYKSNKIYSNLKC